MKAKQYREMAPSELEVKLEELRKHLYDLRSQSVTEKLENCRAISNTRRDIARIKTLMNEEK